MLSEHTEGVPGSTGFAIVIAFVEQRCGTTLGLALLLAFPWQFALATWVVATQSVALGSLTRIDDTGHHLALVRPRVR